MSSTCPACIAPSPQRQTPGAVSGRVFRWLRRWHASWSANRRAARARRDCEALAQLSPHTLLDINAPCIALLQVRVRLEQERLRQEFLRNSHTLPW